MLVLLKPNRVEHRCGFPKDNQVSPEVRKMNGEWQKQQMHLIAEALN